MNMLKELHLVARTIYSFLATLVFNGVTGLSFLTTGTSLVGITIFANSFMFQYFVLHLVLKKITKITDRRSFLIGWLIFCIAGLIGSALMIPHFEDLALYASVEDFSHKGARWGSVFIAFSAALVAMTCTRRAFRRYGAL